MRMSSFATVAALHLSAGSAFDDDDVKTTVFGDDGGPIDEAEDPDDNEGPTNVRHVSIRGQKVECVHVCCDIARGTSDLAIDLPRSLTSSPPRWGD